MRLSLRVEGELERKETAYQSLLVVKTREYGNAMVLDGAIQVTERDEFCYHEMMAHVALCAHPNPRRVLVVGGGDGGSLREVLRHPCIERCVQIDIDEEVVAASRAHFPGLSRGFDDPRAEVRCLDALAYIKERRGEFDLVIVDGTDPVEFAAGLFESPFFRDVHGALAEDGLMTIQTESPFSDPEVVKGAIGDLRKVFPIAKMCVGFLPTYPTGFWTYSIGSKRYDPSVPVRPAPKGCRYYSSEVHSAAFALPPFLKEMIREE
jgi:spermidine synthase